MSPFDAICYSFTTIALGGFAPHDTSIGISIITGTGLVTGRVIRLTRTGRRSSLCGCCWAVFSAVAFLPDFWK
jgi:hypothetical protein